MVRFRVLIVEGGKGRLKGMVWGVRDLVEGLLGSGGDGG